jgi:hypothetical protein
MDFEIGDVLSVEWDEHPLRVLMADEIETFYDAQMPEVGWTMARARTVIYYRTTTSFLGSGAHLVRKLPFTPAEIARHRPDLPLRLLRTPGGDWGNPLQDWPRLNLAFELDCPRLALIPFGPKGAQLKAVMIKADNGRSITGAELLAAAHSIQPSSYEVAGAGLYRSGLTSGVPSYYLWGGSDRAGHAV